MKRAQEGAVQQCVTDFNRKPGWIYFIGADEPRAPIKIGWTGKDPDSRLRGLQTAHPFPLKLLAAVRGTAEEEHCLHAHFRRGRLRQNGEWFRRSNELLGLICHLLGET